MKRTEEEAVFGHVAPGPRLTPLGAALLALAVALPGGTVLWAVDRVWPG